MRSARLLCLAALALVPGGFALATSGCAPAGAKEVRVDVTENGFVPNAVTIRKGDAAVLVITRRTTKTCATEAVFAETGQKYDLPLNQAVRVDLTGVSPGTVHYACGMDMEKGTVKIE
jgi:plastocyanin domain-containing protein